MYISCKIYCRRARGEGRGAVEKNTTKIKASEKINKREQGKVKRE